LFEGLIEDLEEWK